jgi:hypothetical protein
MKNALAKLYPELTPEERFKAMLAAFAREDEGEQIQLKNTCPMKNYKCTDADFSDRMETSQLLVMVTAVDWLQVEGNLKMAETCLEMYLVMMEYFHRGYEAGSGKKADYDPKHDIEQPDKLKASIKHRKIELKSQLVAFETFLELIDVPLDQMLLAWNPPLLQWIENRRPELADVEPDKELTDKILGCYQYYWESTTRDRLKTG